MSTNYYRLKSPFTSCRTEVGGGHTRLSLWVNHAKAGDITLRNAEVPKVLQALARDAPACRLVATAGGGTRLDFDDDNLEPDHVLVSEYGDLTSLADLEAQAVPDANGPATCSPSHPPTQDEIRKMEVKEAALKQSYDDLASSGGIVDAP